MYVDGVQVEVPGRRRRAVVALLATAAGRVVAADTLIDALWGDDPPGSERQALHSLVSRVRGHLGDQAHRLQRDGGGYRLDLDPGEVDAGGARWLVEQARSLAEVDPAAAAGRYREALELWRGPALAEFAEVEALAADTVSLGELHLATEDELLAAELAAGPSAGLVERATELARAEPLRESRQILLMEALAAEGRVAEALRAGHEHRQRLAEETGLEPTPALAELEGRLVTGEIPPPHRPGGGPTTASQPQDGSQARHQPDPGLASAAVRPHFSTPLFGRDAELDRIYSLLGRERLVTLAGAGGVGKTRMAAAIADRWASSKRPVTYLGLAPVQPTDPLPEVLAGVLGMRVEPGQLQVAAIAERLGSGQQLLVVDNCEHLVDAARDLVDSLLSAAADLRVLTTSRVPTSLTAEAVVRIGALAALEAGMATRDRPGVRLFLDRAARIRPGWEPGPGEVDTVAGIVDRLGRIPLAIELAAGRLSSLSLDDLADRVEDALDLLGDEQPGPSARHRSLRSTLEWSYRLLGSDERRLFRHLSAFVDGCDLAAVELVGSSLGLAGRGLAQLAALVDASVVDAELEGDSRYTMHEPVRAFAGEHLVAEDEAAEAASTLAAWARNCAAEIDRLGRGPEEAVADRRIRRELGNFRVAHRAALAAGDLDTAIAITVGLDRTASVRDLPEVWSWAMSLAADPRLESHPRRPEALGAAAEAACLRGDLAAGERLVLPGLALDENCTSCQQALARVRMFRGEPARAQELWTTAAESDCSYLGRAGIAAIYAGDLTGARRLIERGIRWADEHGAPTDLAACHYGMGELLAPDPEAAVHYRRAVELSRRVSSTFVEGVATVGLASVDAAAGRITDALRGYDRLVRYWQRTGNWTQQWTTLRNLADLLAELGDGETAEVLVATASASDEAAAIYSGPPPLTGQGSTAELPPRTVVVESALGAIDSALGAIDSAPHVRT